VRLSVLFIIFGWKRRSKNLGQSYPQYCERCQNDSIFSLFKTRRWLSIFFIPVFPISRVEYFLSCDICGHAAEINRNEADGFKSLIDDTRLYANGRITQVEYEKRIRAVEERAFDVEYDTDVDELVESREEPTRGFE